MPAYPDSGPRKLSPQHHRQPDSEGLKHLNAGGVKGQALEAQNICNRILTFWTLVSMPRLLPHKMLRHTNLLFFSSLIMGTNYCRGTEKSVEAVLHSVLLCYVIQDYAIYDGAVNGTGRGFSDEVLFLTDGCHIYLKDIGCSLGI